jgi:phospholipid transport system transporter-binding protein
MSPSAEGVASPGAFVALGDAWRYEGALTLDNASTVLSAADAMPLPESGRIDMGGVAHADSAALAVVMALRRRALAEGRSLRVDNLPAALHSLAIVYGVDDLVRGTP